MSNTVILLFTSMLYYFLVYDLFSHIFELRYSKTVTLGIGLYAGFQQFLIYLAGSYLLDLLSLPVLLWIFVCILFEGRRGVMFGYFLVSWSVILCCDFLYLVLANVNVYALLMNGIHPASEASLESVLSKFICFLLFQLLKHLFGRRTGRMTNRLFLSYLGIPVISLAIMAVTYYASSSFEREPWMRGSLLVLYVLMILANIILLRAFENYAVTTAESAARQLRLERQEAELKRLTKVANVHDSYAETVHNISHSLKVIDQLAVEKDTEVIRQIVSELSGGISAARARTYSGHRMLDMLLSEYAQKAEERQITFDVYAEPNCPLAQFRDIDLVSMLGNLLDNAFAAVEELTRDYSENAAEELSHAYFASIAVDELTHDRSASTAVDELSHDHSPAYHHAEHSKNGSAFEALPTIRLRIFMQGSRMCVIRVDNECPHPPKIVDGEVISTKKDTDGGIHGIGLASVRKTAEMYDGNFTCYVEDGRFHAVLLFPQER
ncbi:MAG: GHKL domain-containing protein [Lachnospiraceae bacterium]|nr:GHKL domain-containing protein [Lachnospiraceae bacterium]